MIIRSGLIRNRDGVDFRSFGDHWLNVHGPLALRVADMRAYTQNHIVERHLQERPELLHRVDGISQLYFDDVEAMRVAMTSPEQHACIEDIRGFLSDVTIVVQQAGEQVAFGDRSSEIKLLFLLSGDQAKLKAAGGDLTNDLENSASGGVVRFNPVVDRSFAVDTSVPSGAQVIDGVLELWLPKSAVPAALDLVRSSASLGDTVASFEIVEYIMSALPESA